MLHAWLASSAVFMILFWEQFSEREPGPLERMEEELKQEKQAKRKMLQQQLEAEGKIKEPSS